MPPKYSKTKNPCKICLQGVTQKTGLQCHGACKKWVHFSCLNYTPGKIRDIQIGAIKVSCPCPDCKTTYAKELLIDEPSNCTNMKCPTYRPPTYINDTCPKNQKMNQTSGSSLPPCGFPQCPNKNCKETMQSNISNPHQHVQTKDNGPKSSSEDLTQPPLPPSIPASPSSDHVAGDGHRDSPVMPPLREMEHMCDAVGQLTNQINVLMTKMKKVLKEKSAEGGSSPNSKKKGSDKKGLKSICPKPCLCPQNIQK